MIHVIARLETHPGARDAFLEEFARIVDLVRAEPGCIEYVATVDALTGLPAQHLNGPDSVTIIEKWASLQALQAHDASPHMRAFRSRVREHLRGREISMLVPV
jgi:quinol monooxygenase YgiN